VPDYALDHHQEGERERLRLMSRLLDPTHRRHIEELGSGAENQQAAQQSERAKQLGRSLRYEELGIFVFLVGVGLTTAGAIA
jgi:hypothetical protein